MLMLKFAQNSFKNPKMKSLFPPNKSTHTMKTRDHEHFKVFHANTNRYKESPIIYIQNLLNNEIKRRQEEDKMWTI